MTRFLSWYCCIVYVIEEGMRRSEEYSHSFVITFVCCLKSGFINFYMNLKAIRISYQTIILMKRLVRIVSWSMKSSKRDWLMSWRMIYNEGETMKSN